jgi:2-methylcitrate dehydratase PrpD
MIDHGVTAGDRFSHLTSVPYQMAVAALSPDAAFGLSGPKGPISAALAAFMARIAVKPNDSLRTEGYPRAWAAKVTLTAAGGRHERVVTHVPGDPARPFGESDVKAKFIRVVAPALDRTRAEAMFAQALYALDEPKAMIEALGRIG